MSFEGKNVVVTGGTGALGSAVACAFLDQGAIVYASFIKDEELEQLPAAMRDEERCKLNRVDLRDEVAVIAWFDHIESVDVLVNVAGGFAMSSISETRFEDWREMAAMNLDSCFLCCREGLARMKDRPFGRIVNIGAFAACKAPAGMGPYTVSKAGVAHLTEVLAEETLTDEITVNAVLPTIMDTPGNRAAMPDADTGAWVPLPRVAETILYLCGSGSGHITGALIPLRGKL